MKDGLHVTSLYRSTYSKEERNWAPLLFATCLLILASIWGIEQGRQLEKEQRKVLENVEFDN